MSKNILIISYCFLPENSPRSFRTVELAKEFARQGHKVTVYIPEYAYDYSGFSKVHGVTIHTIKPGCLFNYYSKLNCDPNSSTSVGKPKSRLNKKLRQIFSPLYYFLLPDGNATEYAFPLTSALLKERNRFDLLISVSFPFSVHIGTALALCFNRKLARVNVADCSDPFSANPTLPSSPHFRMIESRIMSFFDFIAIPVHNALSSYLPFMRRDRIRIIPQGFDFSEVELNHYTCNPVPTFAYAGAFYRNIRNPEAFLSYLSSLQRDFRFIIYTDFSQSDCSDILLRFRDLLGEKLVLRNPLPRLLCLKELSSVDFLVNIDNLSQNQSPSKLIDYGLTKRPILSFNQRTFDEQVFENFLDGEYAGQELIQLDSYDIRLICSEFLKLCDET